MISNRMIRGITFDVGGTLCKAKLNKELFVSKAVRLLLKWGYNVKQELFRRTFKQVYGSFLSLRLPGREIDLKELLLHQLSKLGIAPEKELIERLRRCYIESVDTSILPGVKETLKALSEEMKLGVVSNSISGWPRRFLELEGLTSYFHTIIISCEVGWRKPHRRIFEIALTKLELRPEEVVHVGNDLIDDVIGAKAVGMKSVLVLTTPELCFYDVKPDAIVSSLPELPKKLSELDF